MDIKLNFCKTIMEPTLQSWYFSGSIFASSSVEICVVLHSTKYKSLKMFFSLHPSDPNDCIVQLTMLFCNDCWIIVSEKMDRCANLINVAFSHDCQLNQPFIIEKIGLSFKWAVRHLNIVMVLWYRYAYVNICCT